MKLYNEKEQIAQAKTKYSYLGEQEQQKVEYKLNPVFSNIEGGRNGIKGLVTLGRNPTQLNFQLAKRD